MCGDRPINRESWRSPFLISPGKWGGTLAVSSKWQHPSPPVPSHPRSSMTSRMVLYGMFTHFLKLSKVPGLPSQGLPSGGRRKRREKVLKPRSLRADAETHRPQGHQPRVPASGTLHPAGRVFSPTVRPASGPSLDEGQHPVWTEQRDCVLAIPTPWARRGDPTTGPSPHLPGAEHGKAVLLRRVLGGRSPWSYRAWPPGPNLAISRGTCTVGREWAEIQAPPGPLWSMMLKRRLCRPGCAHWGLPKKGAFYSSDISATLPHPVL